jgi:hypothetical protein
MFDVLFIYSDTECIPEKVNLLINVSGRTYSKVIEESLIVSFSQL